MNTETWEPSKTKRDRANGAQSRNAQNKALRSEWQKNGKTNNDFPTYTCNGKRTRALQRGKKS